MQLKDTTERAMRYLAENGVKPSVQRVAVMVYLLTHKTHPTADEIFSALYPRIPTLSRTTVYNTLNRLAEQGAILSLDIDREKTRYDGDTFFHGHFLCCRCGKIEDIPVGNPGYVREMVPAGTRVTDIQLLYKGLCAECGKKNDN